MGTLVKLDVGDVEKWFGPGARLRSTAVPRWALSPMRGCKYDIFVSLGLSIGVQGDRGKGIVNSERLINLLHLRFSPASFSRMLWPLWAEGWGTWPQTAQGAQTAHSKWVINRIFWIDGKIVAWPFSVIKAGLARRQGPPRDRRQYHYNQIWDGRGIELSILNFYIVRGAGEEIMPSWSVLTSGWGKRTGVGRGRGRETIQAVGRILDWTTGRKES